jgi:2-oxoglutarate ferredoxin oxidoreductase subunit alpha
MTRLRQAKVDGIDRARPRGRRPDRRRRVLVLGWGSTYGPIAAAVPGAQRRAEGGAGPPAHLNPFPRNTRRGAARYDRVIVPEMNLGQLALLLRAKYLVDAARTPRCVGLPFNATVELADVIHHPRGALVSTRIWGAGQRPSFGDPRR